MFGYSHRVWEGGRERSRLSIWGYIHSFGLVVAEFIYCHPGFDVTSTLLHGDLGFDDGPQICVVESYRRMRDEGQSAFYDSGKRSCVKKKEYRSKN